MAQVRAMGRPTVVAGRRSLVSAAALTAKAIQAGGGWRRCQARMKAFV